MSTIGNSPEELQVVRILPGLEATPSASPSIDNIITFVSSSIVVTKNKEQTKADLQKFKQHEIAKMNDCIRRLTNVSQSIGWDTNKEKSLKLLTMTIGAGLIYQIYMNFDHSDMSLYLILFTLVSLSVVCLSFKIEKNPAGIGMLKGQLESYVKRYGLPKKSRLKTILDQNGKIKLKKSELEKEKRRISNFFEGLINDENLLHDLTRTSEGQILLEVLKPAALNLSKIRQSVKETAVAQDTATELNERLKREEVHERLPYGVASLMLDYLAEVPPD
ncbi:MAG: hypothetical protein H0W88_10205 [Parachlamydiaceae bacterium]|nr:hypothetical protein [Parachlamydiaceae bacterium]